MAGSVRVVLSSVWDDKGIKEAQRSLQGISDGVDKAFKVIGATALAAGAAIGKFAFDAVQGGSDLEQQLGALRAVFGDSSQEVQDFAGSMAEFGLSTADSARMAALLGSQLLGLGLEQSKAVEKTKELQVLAADLAATYGGTTAEAVSALSAIFRQEYNQIERYGVALRKSDITARLAAEGLDKLTGEALKQAEAQAALELIFEKTAVAQGQATREANTFAGQLGTLQANLKNARDEIGMALLPVVIELMQQVGSYLVPRLRELGAWLQSSEGTAAIARLGEAFKDALENVFGFIDFLRNNWQTIANVGGAVLTAMAAIKLYTTTVKLAAAATALWNGTLALNPIGLAVLAIAGLTAALVINNGEVEDSIKNYQLLQSETDQLNYQTKSLADNYRESAWASEAYGVQTEAIVETQTRLLAATQNVSGELGRFNNIKLNSVRNEVKMTADAMAALNQQNMDFARARSGQLTGQASGRGIQTAPVITSTGGGGGGPSKFQQQQELIADAREQIDSALADYNKSVASARDAFSKSIAQANKTYQESIVRAAKTRDDSLARAATDHAKNIASIQADFAKRQADIIQQSINRLRDAYRNAVQVNVADLFGTEQVGKSIDTLVTSLRDRLAASRRLLDNSAQLASAGFSQTFIEQVVGAGVETGNELASAILEATPETQSELQDLFRALEVESNTGMDTLAQTMYEKTGLATDELKKLYEQTNADLVTALAQAQSDYLATQAEILSTFDQAMKDAADARREAFQAAQEQLAEALTQAANALNEQLNRIQKDFDKKIAEMGGAVRSLRNEINALFGMIASARAAAASITVPTITAPRIGDRPDPVPSRSVPATIVNLNVKTDATQSPAQTANKLLEAINARARAGAGLLRRVP